MFNLVKVYFREEPLFLLISAAAVFFGVLALLIKLFFPNKAKEKERLNSVEVARRITYSSQRITRVEVWPHPGMICIGIRADSEAMEEVSLVFSHLHPDAIYLRRIKRLGILIFNFQELPVKKVKKQDPTAYLRLKYYYSPS